MLPIAEHLSMLAMSRCKDSSRNGHVSYPPIMILSSLTVLPFLEMRARLLFLGLLFTSKRISLALDSLLSPLAGGLGLRTFGIHFFLEDSLTLLLGFGLVDLCRGQSKVWVTVFPRKHTCSTNARLCLKVLPLLSW